MIIYHVPEADAGERWLPTLAKAGACAKAYKGTIHEKHAGEDGRDGMCAMLNAAEVEIGERGGDEAMPAAEPSKPFMLPPDVSDRRAQKIAQSKDIDALCDWLEQAEVWQMQRVFETLGGRLSELVKEKRK